MLSCQHILQQPHALGICIGRRSYKPWWRVWATQTARMAELLAVVVVRSPLSQTLSYWNHHFLKFCLTYGIWITIWNLGPKKSLKSVTIFNRIGLILPKKFSCKFYWNKMKWLSNFAYKQTIYKPDTQTPMMIILFIKG